MADTYPVFVSNLSKIQDCVWPALCTHVFKYQIEVQPTCTKIEEIV